MRHEHDTGMEMKVLVAEDDDKIRKGLVEILEEEGYQAVQARNGNEALRLFESERPRFVCLDIMMPGRSGYDVCRAIRASGDDVPIIFISAKSEEIDKVLGLELGADDYILKPFGLKEVIARIRAVTRRCFKQAAAPTALPDFRIADLVVRPGELRALRGSAAIELSLRETKLLQLFASNPGKVLDRDAIFNQCWDMNYLPNSRTLDQHISKLRKKIEADPKMPVIIETVHGAGYRYQPKG
jgi:DNA-binding response OmpR family regulator